MLGTSSLGLTLSNWFALCKENLSKTKRKFPLKYTYQWLNLNRKTEKGTQSFLLSQIEGKFEVVLIKDRHWGENE